MVGRSALCALVGLALIGCTDSAATTPESAGFVPVVTTQADQPNVEPREPEPARPAPSTTARTVTTRPVATRSLTGTVVSSLDGAPLAAATVAVGDQATVTGADGSFALADVEVEAVLRVTRPVWQSKTVAVGNDSDTVTIELEPVVARALRVSRRVAPDPEAFDRLLALADATTVNALVFDTKDEEDTVLYATDVAFANEIGAVEVLYEPKELLARAKEHGLYTITRIVTFEDSEWAGADDEAKLAGAWVDAAKTANWDYPIELAVEACGLGFDEIQFDYVRFPAGQTAISARSLLPPTGAERSAVIATFLDEARGRLHPLGCGVSAAIFGIVMSSATDEGIGQTPETVSAVVDAVSPMLYPSHFGPGWLGFDDPNEHPGPVVAHGLDTGAARMAPTSLMRPWIQGFYYNGDQVLSQIREAEARGAGWIIWNASGTYSPSWLPPSS